MVGLGLSTGFVSGFTLPSAWVYQGSNLDLDFKNNLSWQDSLTNIADVVSLTRATVKTAQAVDGSTESFASGALAITDAGLSAEAFSQNTLNNNNTGATAGVIGSGGSLPTGWTETVSNNGGTVEIVGTGTEDGRAYIDVKFGGTISGIQRFRPMAFRGQSLSAGETWTASAFMRTVAGTAPTGADLRVQFHVSGGAYVNHEIASLDAIGSTYTRFIATGTAAATSGAGHTELAIPAGAIDWTVRIAGWQLEEQATATTLIVSGGSVVDRNADVAAIDPSGWWSNTSEGALRLEVTPDADHGQTNAVLAFLSDGTANNRLSIQRAGTTNNLRVVGVSGGVTRASRDITGVFDGSPMVIVVTWDATGMTVAVNGADAVEDSFASPLSASMDDLRIGTNQAGFQQGALTMQRLTAWSDPALAA